MELSFHMYMYTLLHRHLAFNIWQKPITQDLIGTKLVPFLDNFQLISQSYFVRIEFVFVSAAQRPLFNDETRPK